MKRLTSLAGAALVAAATWAPLPGHAAGLLVLDEGFGSVAGLSDWAEEHDAQVYLLCKPGAFVNPLQSLARVAVGSVQPEGVQKALCDHFAIGPERSFDQDPRFGLTVLAEIGSRALSTGINDSGTAIDILGRGIRVFDHWKAEEAEGPLGKVSCPRVHVMATSIEDAFDDFFLPIARDGAEQVEVQVRLLKALATLAHFGGEFAVHARRCAGIAAQHAELALALEQDKQRVARLVLEVERSAEEVRRGGAPRTSGL